MPSWPRRALYWKQFTDARRSFRASRRVASPTYGPEAPVFIVFLNGLLWATGWAGAQRLHGIAASLSSVAGGRTGGAAGRVVAVAGARDELAASARRNHFDLNVAERAIALGVRRIVRQRVLVANVVRDLPADVVHVLDVFREVREAAGSLRDLLESAFRALGVFLALFA